MWRGIKAIPGYFPYAIKDTLKTQKMLLKVHTTREIGRLLDES